MELFPFETHVIAAFIARTFLGFLFFFQGFDALFNVKIANVIEAYREPFLRKRVPYFLVKAAAWFTSYTELIAGLLLIAGLFTYPALILLGMNLIVASIGFGITTPLWDMRYVFPRLILLLFLLIIPASWNLLSLDFLVSRFLN